MNSIFLSYKVCMMSFAFPRKVFVAILTVLGCVTGTQSASAIPSPVPVADYRADYQTVTFPTGWKYMWNSAGAIGNSANYTNLLWNTTQYASNATPGLPDPAPANFLSLSGLGGHPGMGASQGGSGGISRYAIAAYTVTNPGNYTISDSTWSVLNPSATATQVRVYVNNVLSSTTSLPNGGGTTSFNGSLGALLGGDVIYVAEGGVTSGDFGSFQWDFTINQIVQLPEPSSLLLTGMFLVPLLRRRRERSATAK